MGRLGLLLLLLWGNTPSCRQLKFIPNSSSMWMTTCRVPTIHWLLKNKIVERRKKREKKKTLYICQQRLEHHKSIIPRTLCTSIFALLRDNSESSRGAASTLLLSDPIQTQLCASPVQIPPEIRPVHRHHPLQRRHPRWLEQMQPILWQNEGECGLVGDGGGKVRVTLIALALQTTDRQFLHEL